MYCKFWNVPCTLLLLFDQNVLNRSVVTGHGDRRVPMGTGKDSGLFYILLLRFFFSFSLYLLYSPLPQQPHFNVFTTYLVKKKNEVLLKCYSIAFRCATLCLLGGLNYFAKNTCQIKGVIYMNIFIYII